MDLTLRRMTIADTDPKKDSQLSRADEWLNNTIDPSKDDQNQEQEDQEEKVNS